MLSVHTPSPSQTAGLKMNAILSYVAKTLDAELPGKTLPHDKSSHTASSSGSSTRISVSSVASDASSPQPTSTISDFLSMASSNDSSISSDHQTWLLRQRNAEQHHHFTVSTSQSLISQQNHFTPHPPSYDGTGSPHPPSSSHPSPPTPPRLPQRKSASFSRKSLTSRFHALADPLPEEDDMQSLSSFSAMGERSSNSRTSDMSRKWLGATSVPQPPSAAATFTRASRHSSASGPPSRISLPGNGSMKGNEVLDIRTASMLHGGNTRGYTTDGYSPAPPIGSLAGNFTSNALGMAMPASLDDIGDNTRRSSRASISGGGSVCSTAARSLGGRPLLSRSSTTSFASRKEETVDALLSEQELGKSIHQLHQSGRNDPLAVALQRTLARERARRHSSAAGADIPASRLPSHLDSSSSVATQLSEISRSWVASQALNSPTLFEVLERQSKDTHIFPEQQGTFSEPASSALNEKYQLLTQCASGGDNRRQSVAAAACALAATISTPSAPGKHFFPTPDPTLIPPPPAPLHRMVQRSASLSRMSLSHKQQHPLALSSNDLDLQSLRESIMYQRSSSLATNHTPVPTPNPAPEASQRHRASDDGAFRQHVQAYHSILTNPSHPAAAEEEESEDTVAPLSLVDQRLSAMRISLSEKKMKPGSGSASTRRHGSESGYGSGGRPLSTAALLAHGVTTSNGTSTSQWAARASTTQSIVDGGERGSGGRLPRAATMTAVTSGGRQSPAGAGTGNGEAVGAPASPDTGVVSSARRSITRASSFNSRGRA